VTTPFTRGSASLIELASSIEQRGSLSAATLDTELPFVPNRMFVVYDVPSGVDRGGHAHLECHQFLLAVNGALTVDWHDGKSWGSVRLSSPTVGLHLSPHTWGVQRDHQPGTVLVVLASHPYDRADYVSDFDDFTLMHATPSDRS
jgi:UDP-2-acetamido-3-amino-2,3-dideoxy-glucuronate N-acetyltransferase